MPIVRVSGNDAEVSLSFDVAKMDDRQRGGGRSSFNNKSNSRHHSNNNNLHPGTPDTLDDLTSLDTSSGRTWSAEELDRLGSTRGSGTSARRRNSNSNQSTNSYYSYSQGGADGDKNGISHNQMSTYNNTDNLDEIEHAPRRSINRKESLVSVGWSPGDYIPEEDETSLSTLDEESVTRSSSNNNSSPQNLNNSQQHMHNQSPTRQNSSNSTMHQHQPPQHRLSHRSRQKQPLIQQQQQQQQQSQHSQHSDSDDNSIISSQSHQSSSRFERKSSTDKSSAVLIAQQGQTISQLESQVMKLNLDLATTKSSMDEIQLENRKLQDGKDKLANDVMECQEENHQLRLTIERLEKEKILRNMDGTRGNVNRSSERTRSFEHSSVVVWGEKSVSGNTWKGSGDNKYTVVTQQPLGKVGGSLEVPFRTTGRRQSTCSSINDLSTVSDEDVDYASCSSVALGSVSDNKVLESCQQLDPDGGGVNDDEDAHKGRMSLLNVFGGRREGGGKKPPISSEEAYSHISSPLSPAHSTKDEDENDTSERDMGSNPQGETFNDDDPFATWSAPGDSKREKGEQNWFQRGLGGKGKDGKNNTRQPPQSQFSDDIIEDPFDTCRDNYLEEENEKLKTSFSERSGDGSISNAGGTGKRSGLFQGWGRGRRGND